MIARVLRRIAGALVTLVAAASVTFFAVRLIPGDPAQALLGGPGSQASAEALAQVRAENGLDQPLLVQYLSFLGRLLRGDLGNSYLLHDSVSAVIGEQIGGTLLLAIAALVLAWLFALALALWSTRPGRGAARVGELIEMVAAALPHFWLGAALIAVFSGMLGILPAVSVPGVVGLILPALTLAIPLAGFLAQLLRESLADAAAQPFIFTARARGESESRIFWTHTLRHAAPAAVGLSGWAFGSLISGAVVVETVFARPGLGRTLVQATTLRDVPLVVGVVLVSAAAYVLVSLIADLTERALTPTVAVSA